jgi:hypothetical protein
MKRPDEPDLLPELGAEQSGDARERLLRPRRQGCQMVCFQTKNPNLGKFWRALDWKMFQYCLTIWNILWIFGMFYDHLVHFVFIW